MTDTSWLNDFDETCQVIQEDAVLLAALAAYLSDRGGGAIFPQTLTRLTDYLSQHAGDLLLLKKRLVKAPL